MIYVIGNLSNTILIMFGFSSLRACVSDDWGSVMILTEPLFYPGSSLENNFGCIRIVSVVH